MGKRDVLTFGALIMGGLLVSGIAYMLSRSPAAADEDLGESEFKNLNITTRAKGVGAVYTTPIIKRVGDTWGGTLTIQHKGRGGTFYMGLCFRGTGSTPGDEQAFYDCLARGGTEDSCYYLLEGGEGVEYISSLYKPVTFDNDVDWTTYTVEIDGVVTDDIPQFVAMDVYRFLGDAAPKAGVVPPNPYGLNVWDTGVYTIETESQTQTYGITYY